MDEKEKSLPEEEPEVKSSLQTIKESWYDKIPLTLKQLDGIVVLCWILLAVTVVFIVLDVLDIFHVFSLFR